MPVADFLHKGGEKNIRSHRQQHLGSKTAIGNLLLMNGVLSSATDTKKAFPNNCFMTVSYWRSNREIDQKNGLVKQTMETRRSVETTRLSCKVKHVANGRRLPSQRLQNQQGLFVWYDVRGNVQSKRTYEKGKYLSGDFNYESEKKAATLSMMMNQNQQSKLAGMKTVGASKIYRDSSVSTNALLPNPITLYLQSGWGVNI